MKSSVKNSLKQSIVYWPLLLIVNQKFDQFNRWLSLQKPNTYRNYNRMLYNYTWNQKEKYKDDSDFNIIQKLAEIDPPQIKQSIIIKEKLIDVKKREIYERKEKKDKIVKQLTQIFSLINEDVEIQSQDLIMRQLKNVKKVAQAQNYQDIFMTVKTAIGRRIYNIEREKNKVKKKQVMNIRDLYYKNDRRYLIEVFPYDKICQQKFLENTFVFEAYPNGVAFNYMSCKYTSIYQSTFKEIEAEHIIKTINRLFCKPEQIFQTFTDKLFKYLRIIGTLLSYFVFVCMILQFIIFYFLEEGVIRRDVEANIVLSNIFFPMIIVVVIRLMIAMRQCGQTKQTQSNFEKTIQLIEEYIVHINNKNIEDCKFHPNKIKFKWESDKKLFYVTVKVNKILEVNTLMNSSMVQRERRK